MPAPLPELPFADAAEWEKWLEDNGSTAEGIWLVLAKKDSEVRSVTYAEAVEVALCHGWIDGHKTKSEDPRFWRQRFTRRGPRSRWSEINVGKAEALIASGRMRPAGLREVERARSDGRWEAAYAPASTATVPPDLQAALDAEPAVTEAFLALNSANRFAVLYRVHDAKRPETRARRIAQFVEMLREGRTLHP